MLADTKRLLGINDASEDELLEFFIDDSVKLVLASCRLSVLPYQLYGVIPQLAADIYRLRKNAGIASLTEGDRRIEYNTEDILKNYNKRLMTFKSKLPSELDSNKLY